MLGEIEDSVGAGGVLTVKTFVPVPAAAPGFVTTTLRAPAVALKAIVMLAVIEVALLYVSELTAMLLPKVTLPAVRFGAKSVPLIVTSSDWPWMPLFGEVEVTVAWAFDTVIVVGLPIAVPPSVAVMFAVPAAEAVKTAERRRLLLLSDRRGRSPGRSTRVSSADCRSQCRPASP